LQTMAKGETEVDVTSIRRSFAPASSFPESRRQDSLGRPFPGRR
jgi:hypothetical protein